MTQVTQHPDDLLPWYVNGTLAGGEREQVETHLQACERCRQEVTLLRAIQAGAQQAPGAVPVEFAWQRLRRDMRRQPSAAPRQRSVWQVAMATAAALVIVVQTVMIVNLGQRDDTFSPAGHQLPGAIAQVRFQPDSREADIRAALQAIDAEIVAGPGANGLYRIRLADNHADPAAEKKIETLRQRTSLVEYIERD